MIKLFRRFRQKLLTGPPERIGSVRAGNKFSKYLLYAIGEIILVVIGILLALQINDWNQRRIENKTEIELLNNLHGEFKSNLTFIEKTITANKKVTQSCIDLTEIIRANSISKKQEEIDELLGNISGFASFDARTGISAEIVNSGKLRILKNDDLRAHLGNWITLLIDSEEDILIRSDNYTLNLMPFLMKRFPLANAEMTKSMNNDKRNYLVRYKKESPFRANFSQNDLLEFENQIWTHKNNHDYVLINELNVRDFIIEIIQIIEKELEK